MAIDAEGGFFIACYYAFQILRTEPGGGAAELLEVAGAPLNYPER